MIKLEFDEKSIASLLTRVENLDPKDQGKAVYRGFVRAALLVERALKGNISGAYLKVRSQRLVGSIGSRVDVEDDGLAAYIGSGVRQGERVPYANIQETGGTIVPRVRRWLTIPLDAAKTASGMARFSARDVRRGSTKYKGSFIHNDIIFGVLQRRGKGKSSIVPLFVLKSSVTLPPSHYLTRTSEETFADANKEVLDTIKEGLKQ